MTTERIRLTGRQRTEIDLDRLSAALLLYIDEIARKAPDEAEIPSATAPQGVAS